MHAACPIHFGSRRANAHAHARALLFIVTTANILRSYRAKLPSSPNLQIVHERECRGSVGVIWNRAVRILNRVGWDPPANLGPSCVDDQEHHRRAFFGVP